MRSLLLKSDCFRLVLASASLCVAPLFSGEARATIVSVTSSSLGSQFAYTVSATDLINQGQATLDSAAYANINLGGGSTTSALNNSTMGTTNSTLNSDVLWDTDGIFTATYTLNTTVNTLGYSISQVETFAGWPSDRAKQKYELLYSTVAAPGTFISLGTFSFSTANISGSTRVSLTDDSGFLATGVKAIRFNVQSPGVGAETVYREFDVIGIPTPEPSSLGMLFVGFIALLSSLRNQLRKTAR